MINGDSKNNIINKILYFPQCLYNLNILSRSKKCLNIIEVELVKLESATGSPSRILSNMFWETINWVALAQQLGSPVKIFDIACGKGHYGNEYRRLLRDNFESYTGIDIYKNKQFPSNFTHILDRAEFSAKYIKEENLITSQSGLEHIEKDFSTLLEITDKLVKNKKPFIQIHLVPASLSLFLFLWHGYRQYSLNNLEDICCKLNRRYNINVSVVPLGGLGAFFVHLKQITFKRILFRLFKKECPHDWDKRDSLANCVIQSVVSKERCANKKFPSFWALIIHSNDFEIEKVFQKNNKD